MRAINKRQVASNPVERDSSSQYPWLAINENEQVVKTPSANGTFRARASFAKMNLELHCDIRGVWIKCYVALSNLRSIVELERFLSNY